MPKVRRLLDRLPGFPPLPIWGRWLFLHRETGIIAAIAAGIYEGGNHGDSPA